MSVPAGGARRRGARSAAGLGLLTVALAVFLVACGHGERRAGQTRQRPGGPGPAPSTSAAGIPVGRSSFTLTVAGAERTVRLYRPAGLTEPAPLVVMLHGGYGSGAQAETSYRWDEAAESGGFLAAFPDGTNRSWNAGGGCCGPAAESNVDDVGFLREMVAALHSRIEIDPRRRFVTGMSNGGAMAYRMACQADLFAAVGAVSTTMLVDCPAPARASILHIHGRDDHSIRYDGEVGEPFSRRQQGIDGPPVPAVHEAWQALDGCQPPLVSITGVLTTSTASCLDGRAVELVTIEGAGHQWPGSEPNRLTQLLGADEPSTALDATGRIWEFFAAHPAPAG